VCSILLNIYDVCYIAVKNLHVFIFGVSRADSDEIARFQLSLVSLVLPFLLGDHICFYKNEKFFANGI